MIRPPALCMALCLGLAACGSTTPKGPPPDQTLDLHLAAGRAAMALARYHEAADDYRQAYRQALVRDDPASVATAGVDLTIALTAGDRPIEALAASRAIRSALAARFVAPAPPELALAEAAALLRLDRAADAAQVAAEAEGAPAPDIAARAAFLHGLAADRLGDTRQLTVALTRLSDNPKVPSTWQADRLELRARLSLADGQSVGAIALAEDAAAIRRSSLDYRGMRRALGVAAAAASRAGRLLVADSLRAQIRDSAANGSGGAPATSGGRVAGPGGGLDAPGPRSMQP